MGARRQANWKLDPPLRKACKPSVRRLCDAEDRKNLETGLVYKCLISKFQELDPPCQKASAPPATRPVALGCCDQTGMVQHGDQSAGYGTRGAGASAPPALAREAAA